MGHRGSTSDILQEAIGGFGRWQASISILMALLKLPIAWFQLSIIILEAHSDFWCARPPGLYGNLTIEEWKNLSHPRLGNRGYDACRIYDLNYTSDEIRDVAERNNTVACQNWEYSRNMFTENIVTEWNLVCSRSILADVAQATFMSGVLLGNVLFGVAADRVGRKVPLIVAIGLQAVSGVISSFSPWFSGFLVARFLMALATGGTMIISFVLVMEIIGNEWRTTIAILYQIPFSLGICLMAGISYLQRDWRDFHFTLSALSAAFLVYWWFIPESPRWLLAVGREMEALQIMEGAARWNGRDVATVKNVVRDHKPEQSALGGDRKVTLADLMRTPNLRWNSLSLFFSWFLAGLSFFGFSQSLGKVGGNIFVTTIIAGIIGVPGTLACIYMVRFGRKNSICTSHIVTGAMCLLLIAVPTGMFPGDWPRVLLSAIALTGMCMSFPALYVFSGELFPTVVRNIGLGSASMFSRFGSILAPFIKSLDAFGDFWPPLIFGCCSLLGAAVIAFLPETKDCRLPDTLEDGEQFGNKRAQDKENRNYIQVSQQQNYSD